MNQRRNPGLIAVVGLLTLAGCGTPREAANSGGLVQSSTDRSHPPSEGLDTEIYRDARSKIDPYATYDLQVVASTDPSGTSGTLSVPPGNFSVGNNSQACFPTSAGWDRYYTTYYFVGPDTVPPNPNNYPNTGNQSVLEVTTNDPANTGIEAGVVIIDNLNPSIKKCSVPLTVPPLLGGTSLTMGVGRKYRVTIFYKSSTLGAKNSVVLRWNYSGPTP